MAYLISEEAKDLLQDVHEFCENEVKEQCKAYDVSGEWPKEIYDKAIETRPRLGYIDFKLQFSFDAVD